MADQIYKVRDPQGNLREIKGPSGASDDEIIAQAQKLFAAPAAAPSEVPGPRQEPGFLTKFGRSAASLADVVAGDIPAAIAQQVTYPAARMFTTPERATEISQAVSEPIRQPFGRAFGVTETPEYQAEASRKVMDFIGQNVGKGTKWLAQKTGLPETDVANMVGTMTFAAPELNKLRPRLGVNNLVENLTTGTTASLTGKPAQAYKEAFKAGKTGDEAFTANLRGEASPNDILDAVQQGIAKMRTDTSQAYANAKTGWAADKTPLNFAPIDEAYAKVRASLEQGGKSKIGKAEQNIVDEIGTVLDEWKKDPSARTALDFDALKQRIDAIYPESPKQAQAQRAITTVRNAVKDEITKNIGEYAGAMKDYELQQELLRDITKGLSTGDKVAKETALNKIMGALKSTPSAEMRRDLLNAIKEQTGIDLTPSIAGQTLQPWKPTLGFGHAALGGGLTTAVVYNHPEMLGVLPFTSPRLMGEMYYGAGKAAGAGQRAVNALSNLTPEQQAYVNSLMLESQQTTNKNALAR